MSSPGHPEPVDPLRVFAQVFFLWSVAITAPVTKLETELGIYFKLYQCDGVDLALLLLVAGALAPVGSYVLAKRLPRLLGHAFHRVAVGCLLVGATIQVTGFGGGALGWGLGVALLVLVTPGLWRRPARALTAAGLIAAACLYVGVQAARSPLLAAVRQGQLLPAAGPGLDADQPVFLLVFDELPLFTLLTCEGEIDGALYPNFARLAAISDWMPRASSVHPFTLIAVPALLTGREPVRFLEPNRRNYPGNVFQLLAATHKVVSFEHLTQLSPPRSRDPNSPWASRLGRQRAILADLGTALPTLLRGDADLDKMTALAGRLQAFQQEGGERDVGQTRFERFLEAIEPGAPRTFYYYHSWLPHSPWTFLPDGTRYPGFHVDAVKIRPGQEGTKFADYHWVENQEMIRLSAQRIVLQTQYVDRLLGRFLDKVEAAGLLDRALMVVTADHGNRMQSGVSMREYTGAGGAPMPGAAEQILSVPMFFKRPGQRRGRVLTRPVRTVDIPATIADALEIPLPWAQQGRSWLAEGEGEGGGQGDAGTEAGEGGGAAAPARSRVVAWDPSYRRHELDYDWDVSRRKACWLQTRFEPPEGVAPAEAPMYLAPFGKLVGTPQADFYRVPRPLSFSASWEGWQSGGKLRVLHGTLRSRVEPTTVNRQVFIFAEGRLVGITTAMPHAPHELRFVCFLPEASAPAQSAPLTVAMGSEGPEGIGYIPLSGSADRPGR